MPASSTLPRPEETASALNDAVRRCDWAEAGAILDEAWIDLALADNVDAVGRAVAMMPVEDLRAWPAAGFLAENIGRLAPGTIAFELPEDEEALRAIGRSPSARLALSRCLSAMAGRRRRGRHEDALRFVRRGSVIADAAQFVMFHDADSLLPLWRLHAGITAQLAGETDLARRLHRAAYVDRGRSGYDIVGRDAAGNMAMIEALDGNLLKAKAWLDRAAAESHRPVWLGPMIQVPIDAAAGLLAADRLDHDGCRRFLAGAGSEVGHDEQWPSLLVAKVAVAMVLGDVPGAVAELDRLRAAHQDWIGSSGLGRILLALVAAELAMAQGQGAAAHAALADLPRGSAVGHAARARLALLEGDRGGAEALVESAGASAQVSLRARLELLLIGATVAAADDRENLAEERLAAALRLARPHGILRCFASVPRALLTTFEPRLPGLGEVRRRLEDCGMEPVYPESLVTVRLTARERDLLAELAGDRTLDQIAQRLFVSPNTVKTHMRAAYQVGSGQPPGGGQQGSCARADGHPPGTAA